MVLDSFVFLDGGVDIYYCIKKFYATLIRNERHCLELPNWIGATSAEAQSWMAQASYPAPETCLQLMCFSSRVRLALSKLSAAQGSHQLS